MKDEVMEEEREIREITKFAKSIENVRVKRDKTIGMEEKKM